MISPPVIASAGFALVSIIDCWNKIGVHGDGSCPVLEKYTHCRNCPTYTAAAAVLLDRDLPANHFDDWTRHVAQTKSAMEDETQSVVVFRLGPEWLALPTTVFREIVNIRPIHSLPHRSNEIVLGLTNIRGELLVCISLHQILRLNKTAEPNKDNPRAANPRMLFMQHGDRRVVCPVEEVFGVQRFSPRELMAPPATLAKAPTTYTKAVLAWNKETVGLLDEHLLFHSVNRGLA
ncbi:MAG TPA: chemotaxis protein CheW [Phyllobacterium sp.]|nr:chemotaxis protein CheW [Phyllobacterium sp.]